MSGARLGNTVSGWDGAMYLQGRYLQILGQSSLYCSYSRFWVAFRKDSQDLFVWLWIPTPVVSEQNIFQGALKYSTKQRPISGLWHDKHETMSSMVGFDFSVCLFLLNVKRWLKKIQLSCKIFFLNHCPPRFIDSKWIRNLSLWAGQICLCVLVLFCFAEPFLIEENLNVSSRTYL